jgi:hypothetical protein
MMSLPLEFRESEFTVDLDAQPGPHISVGGLVFV